MKKIVSDLDKDFINLEKTGKLDIFSIEDLMIKNVEEYKELIHHHLEELLQREVDENRLIIKKNKNGKITDIISVTKEKKK